MTDFVIIAGIFAFLLCYFEPRLLFSKTITTGGDTGSHYYTAEYLRNYLLPKGKISGWCQGNLAGYAILQYYFPIPFLVMAILSWFIPLEIAFKLGTVLGIFLIPAMTYFFFRLIKQPFPVPILGAVFSLPFLFSEGYSMWGGNIPSTLAGQFSYSLGFALSILWLGLLYDCMHHKKKYTTCAVVLSLIGLCHGYALIFCVFASTFFLLTKRDFTSNLKRLVLIHLTSFCLIGFWLFPLLAFLPYSTRFSLVWTFFDWAQVFREILPSITYPFVALSIFAAIWAACKSTFPSYRSFLKPWGFVWFCAVAGVALYLIGYRIGVVDIRFLPFFQFFLIVAGVFVFSLFPLSKRAFGLLASILLILTCVWVDNHVTFIRSWIRSNYAGYESKRLWDSYQSVNEFLRGSVNDPRVAYEYSRINEGAGTIRAFEALPYFSGRSTLEGLQLPASLCVPSIFYLQSEISQSASMPIPEYNYSRFNLQRGAEHLRLFNVGHVIAVENETKEAMRKSPDFLFVFGSGPYEIYRVEGNSDRYVEPLQHDPVVVTTDKWRDVFYKWFRLGDLSTPLVYLEAVEEGDLSRFPVVRDMDVRHLPKKATRTDGAIRELVSEEEVEIDGAPVGKPLLIKIAYHPSWQAEGADQIYLASPGFMLIYPTSTTVRLYYGRLWSDYIGFLCTGLSLLWLVVYHFALLPRFLGTLSRLFDRYGAKAGILMISASMALLIYYLVMFSKEYPTIPYYKGIEFFDEGAYGKARDCFEHILEEYPQSIIADHASYLKAMCFYREKSWKEAILELMSLLKVYPETRKASEALYVIGLCHESLGQKEKALKFFEKTVREFSEDTWVRLSRERLKGFEK